MVELAMQAISSSIRSTPSTMRQSSRAAATGAVTGDAVEGQGASCCRFVERDRVENSRNRSLVELVVNQPYPQTTMLDSSYSPPHAGTKVQVPGLALGSHRLWRRASR
jgi:hypothetical protein